MGQDREFTDEQKKFALKTIERFIEIWELEERTALAADRDRRLETLKQEEEADVSIEQQQAADIAQ